VGGRPSLGGKENKRVPESGRGKKKKKKWKNTIFKVDEAAPRSRGAGRPRSPYIKRMHTPLQKVKNTERSGEVEAKEHL